MVTNSFLKTLTETIDNLSFAEPYEELYHECTEGVPLPSNDVLRKIIDITRGIVFPGYYGKSNVHVDTLKFGFGVDIEELYSLLVTQIQAGLTFSRFDEGSAGFAAYNQYTLINEMQRLAEDRAEKFISVLPELRRVLATIGGNIWVMQDVPAGASITQKR